MNKDEFLKRDWYVQGFNAVPNLISHGHTSSIKYMSNQLGYGYKFMMNSFKNDFCEYYYDWADLKEIYKKVLDLIKENSSYLTNQENVQRELWKIGLVLAKEVRITDLTKLNKTELFELYHKILRGEYVRQRCIETWIFRSKSSFSVHDYFRSNTRY